MADLVTGLMNTPKYAKNIIRVGDLKKNAPYTILSTDVGGTTVVLPLPINLSSQMGADWQQESVSLGKSALLHGKEFTNEMLAATSYTDIIASLKKQGAQTFDGANEDVKAILARSRNSKSKLGGARLSSNPRNEMLFRGMPFKSYSFQFNLIPYRQQDSAQIQNAIRAIQKASAPAMKFRKTFMEYPETWFIKFMSGEGKRNGNEYLMKLNECCCTSVSINYTPQSDSSNMHNENAPLAVELSLDFTELFIPTKETIDNPNGGENFNG